MILQIKLHISSFSPVSVQRNHTSAGNECLPESDLVCREVVAWIIVTRNPPMIRYMWVYDKYH